VYLQYISTVDQASPGGQWNVFKTITPTETVAALWVMQLKFDFTQTGVITLPTWVECGFERKNPDDGTGHGTHAFDYGSGADLADYSIIHTWAFQADNGRPVDFRYKHNGSGPIKLSLWQAKAISI